MWHLREISDDEVTIDIFAYSDREFGFVSSECNIFEDLLDPDGISFLIGHLYSYEAESWYRCLYSDGFCLECESEIFFEGNNLGEPDSFTWSETVLDDGRPDTLIFHLDIDAELEECALYEERLLLDLLWRDDIDMLDIIEEPETREVPSPEVDRFRWMIGLDFLAFWSFEWDFFRES